MKVELSQPQFKCNKVYLLALVLGIALLYWLQTFIPIYQGFKWSGPTAKLNVELQKPIFTTDEKFLSFGMDSNLIRHRWDTFDFKSQKLQTLAKGLAPAYLRLMGTDGDRMLFAKDVYSSVKFPKLDTVSPIITDFPFPGTVFNMTASDWDLINKFVSDVGWRLLFGVNAQTRTINKKDNSNKWNSTNTEQLLEYSVKQGYDKNIDFEFGNEPESWRPNNNFTTVPPSQLAVDYKAFRQILNNKFNGKFKSSLLAGPGNSFTRSKYITDFLDKLEDGTMHAATWHFYNGAEKEKFVNNYTDPLLLDKYTKAAQLVVNIVKKSKRSNIRIWQGEASSLVRPPGNGICESYVAGFMLLDKLGQTAKLGMDLIIRQTFYGFWFALVDHRHFPRPNYWISLIFKRLVGKNVLKLDMNMESGNLKNNPARLRGYAHCTATKSGYPSGSIVVYAMNLFDTKIRLAFPGPLENSNIIDQYLLTAPHGNLTSVEVELNGSILKMESDRKLPTLKPVRVKTIEIVLPKMSMAYYVFKDVKVKSCL